MHVGEVVLSPTVPPESVSKRPFLHNVLRVFTRAVGVSACTVLGLSATSFSQRAECREPTAQERAAVENAQRVLQQVVSIPIEKLGWKLASQKADGGSKSVAASASPKRPLMLCWPIYDAKFDLTADHPQYSSLRARADHGQEEMKQWMSDCIKNNYKGCDVKPQKLTEGEHAIASLSIEVRVLENDPFMHLTQPETLHRLNIPGTDVAYRSDSQQEYLTDTTVCTGTWKPDVVFSNGRDVPFPFQHGPGTPYIENLCVKITAPANMADEIVGKINWKQLSDALTR